MKLAYLIDGGMNDPLGTGLELYDQFPQFRELYAQVADWTGLTVERMQRWELPRQQEHEKVGAIRQAAVAFGVADLLAERGIRPTVVAGLSLGCMVGACLVGAVDREDLFAFLAHKAEAPFPAGPPQAVGALFAPVDVDVAEFLGGPAEGVFVAGELGLRSGGKTRAFLISGYREALEDTQRVLPDGAMRVAKDVHLAIHSPLSGPLNEYLAPAVAKMNFRDPELSLCSCMEPRMLNSAHDIREMFLRNQVEPVSLPHLFANVMRDEPGLGLLLGPAQLELFLDPLPIPIVQVETPDQLSDAMTALYELRM
ncbi:hypothetical protein ACIP5Y_47830 [Nocardia sp. NPDC088792]|uniref:hypothetical protein n=1 Tax=Nocardia sp. NPDC088792 TaxID=3364332 RepID=UPI00380C1A19